jgi:hypothetical protein
VITHLVHWTDDTLGDLASMWLTAADPRSVTQAQAAIDSLLSRNPLGHGAEISEGLRELTVPPLRILYSVDTNKRVVEVSAVKWSR